MYRGYNNGETDHNMDQNNRHVIIVPHGTTVSAICHSNSLEEY